MEKTQFLLYYKLNFSRVPSDLSSLESTTDGYSVVLGMVDGNLTVLTIADPKKPHMSEYLNALPSRCVLHFFKVVSKHFTV